MMVTLKALTAHDLHSLVRSEEPAWTTGLVAEGALPPPFVAERALAQLAAGKPRRWCSTFFIVRDADQLIVGGCGFKDVPHEGRVEIGYAVSPACRSQGMATAAVQALLDFAASAGGVTEVVAEVDLSNFASTRVVHKLGFERCGAIVGGDGAPGIQWRRPIRPVVKVDVAQRDAITGVREFYKSLGYGGEVSEADLTLVATTAGRLAGVVRLCDENGVMVLRGMHIAPEFQRQGIGSVLLDHCAPYLDRGAAFCLPYAHLAGFYGRCGFAAAPAETLPAFLATRLQAYLASGQRVLAMRRAPGQDAGAGGLR